MGGAELSLVSRSEMEGFKSMPWTGLRTRELPLLERGLASGDAETPVLSEGGSWLWAAGLAFYFHSAWADRWEKPCRAHLGC